MSLITLADGDGNGKANINTGNKSSESVVITMNFGYGEELSKQDFKSAGKTNEGGKLSLHLGANKKVGGTAGEDANEFREKTGGFLNVDWKGNEIEDLLNELFNADRKGENGDKTDGKIAGVELIVNGPDSVTLALDNGQAVDYITIEGEWIEGYLASTPGGFDLFNPIDQYKVFCFDADKNNESIFTGRSDNLDESAGAVGELFAGSFLNDGEELENFINAALDEKYGLGETKDLQYVTDDGDSIVIEVTNQNTNGNGPGTDTFILKGTEVENVLDAYTTGGVNVGNKSVETAARDYNGDADGNVFLGANKNKSNEAEGSNELRETTGASMSQSDAERLLLNLLDDDGTLFTEGMEGEHSFTKLAAFEEDRIVLEITNRSDTSLNDSISLLNDWDTFVDVNTSEGFAALKAAHDDFSMA